MRRLVTKMALRDLNSTLKEHLLEDKEFILAHLIKFEKPKLGSDTSTQATDYVYMTDAPYPLVLDSEIYIPSNILQLGSVRENISAKSGTMTLKLAASSLGTSFIDTLTFNGQYIQSNYNWSQQGFKEGDIITFTQAGTGSAGSYAHRTLELRIDTIKESAEGLQNRVFGTVLKGSLGSETGKTYKISTDNPQLNSLFVPKTDSDYSSYVHRNITVYRAYIDPETGNYIGNPDKVLSSNSGELLNNPFTLFKGNISNCVLNENATSGSTVSWTLTDHWGDFVRRNGRRTSDGEHRKLDADGNTVIGALDNPGYAYDYGFEHSEKSINAMTQYSRKEQRTGKDWSSNGVKKLFGGKKTVTYWVDVKEPVELNFNLAAKYIPVVYGVRKVKGTPFFIDTGINIEGTEVNEGSYVYQAVALAEGPIAGLYDIHVEGDTILCTDGVDATRRAETSDSTAICYGNAEMGRILSGVPTTNFSNTKKLSFTSSGQEDPDLQYRSKKLNSVGSTIYTAVNGYDVNYPTSSRSSLAYKGIGANQTFKIAQPQQILVDMFVGTSDQRSSDRLTKLSRNGHFKLQNDYYKGTNGQPSPFYWTPLHRVLDTAYVVNRTRISADSQNLPDLDYVIKGKFVECFNYDGSYEPYNQSSVIATWDKFDDIKVYNLSNQELGGPYKLSEVFEIDRNKADRVTSVATTGVGSSTRFRVKEAVELIEDIGTNEKIYFVNTSKHTNVEANRVYCKTYLASKATSLTTAIDVDPISASVTAVTNEAASGDTTNTISISFSNNSIWDSMVSANANEYQLFEFKNTTTGKMYRTRVSGRTGDSSTDISGTTTHTQTLTIDRWASYEVWEDIHDDIAAGQSVVIILSDLVCADNNQSLTSLEVGSKVVLTTGESSQTVRLVDVNSTSGTRKYLAFSSNVTTIQDASTVDSTEDDLSSDLRTTLNPAMQLLDYLTSHRYGKGLSIDRDIDLPSFLTAARDCDTTSDITIITNNLGSEHAVGDVFTYHDGKIWSGEIAHISDTISFNGDTFNTVRFTNCSGKLCRRLIPGQTYEVGDLVYSGNDIRKVTSSFTANGSSLTTKKSSASSQLNSNSNLLWNSSTASNTPMYLYSTNTNTVGRYLRPYIHKDSDFWAQGTVPNPIIKDWSGIDFTASGYSLYDADEVKYWALQGWNSYEQFNATRHQCSMAIDTSETLFDNVNAILAQFSGLLSFTNGKYSLNVKKACPTVLDSITVDSVAYTPAEIHKDDIIGSLKVEGKPVKDTFNTVSTRVNDVSQKFNSTDITFFNSTYLAEDRGIPKSSNIAYPGINNYFNARLNIQQELDRSRSGLTISFKTKPSAILLKAGDFVRLTHPDYGFTNKTFRITSLSLEYTGLIQISATEHDASTYALKGVNRGTEILVGTDDSGRIPVKIENPPVLATTTDENGNVIVDIANTVQTLPQKIILNWTHSAEYDPAFYMVEVWRHPSEPTSVDGNGNTVLDVEGVATKVGVTSGTEFTDNHGLTEDGLDYYYYLRYIATGKGVKTGDMTKSYSDFTAAIIADITPLDAAHIHYVADDGPTIESLMPATANADDTSGAVNAGITVNSSGGGFTINQNGHIKSQGRISEEVNSAGESGFFLGYNEDSEEYTFGIGDQETGLIWDGDELSVTGNIDATTMTLSDSIEIGSTNLATEVTDSLDLADTASQVNKGLALLLNQNASGGTNSGEVSLVAIDKDGNPDLDTDGFIHWQGARHTIPHDTYDNITILTHVSGKKGFIAFDINKSKPFNLGQYGYSNAAFVWKEGDQWYYDDNSATPVSFSYSSLYGSLTTPVDTTGTLAHILALGYLQTSSSTTDAVLKGGLFGEVVDIELASMPSDDINSGTIAGIKVTSTSIESTNFSTGAAGNGFKIASDGTVEASSGTFRGNLDASTLTLDESITIGAANLPSDIVSGAADGATALEEAKEMAGNTDNLVKTPVFNEFEDQGGWSSSETDIVELDEESDDVTFNNGFDYALKLSHATLPVALETTNIIPVNGGETIYFSAWVNAEYANQDVSIGYRKYTAGVVTNIYTKAATLTAGTAGWKLLSGVVDLPDDTISGIQPWIEIDWEDGDAGSPGVAYFNAIRISRGPQGNIGGITINSNKLYQGTGQFDNANTGFYLDNSGNFSLQDKLKFDADGGDAAGEGKLTIKGDVEADSLTLASGISIGTGNLASDVLDSLEKADNIPANQFSARRSWEFDIGTQGWSPITHASIDHGGSGIITVTSSGNDPTFQSPDNLNFDGGRDHLVVVRFKRTAGTGWQGTLYYATHGTDSYTSHSYHEDYKKNISDPTNGESGDYVVATWDMSDLTNGDDDWVDNDIKRLRFDLGNASGDQFKIDWIAIGSIGSAGLRDGADLQSGTVGGTVIDTTKIYQGEGNHNNSDTGFYLDNAGNFSIQDKLSFNGTDLTVSGDITAENLTLEADATVTGTLSADNIAIDDVMLDTVNGDLILKRAGIGASRFSTDARLLMNPVSQTGNVNRWGGYDDYGNVVNTINDETTVSYDSTEKALKLETTNDDQAIRCEGWPVNHNNIYKITFSVKPSSTQGLWYVGATQSSTFIESQTMNSGHNGQTSMIFPAWYSTNRTQYTVDSNGNATGNFYFRSVTGSTTYTEMSVYMLGNNVSIDDVPQHVGDGGSPYVRLNADAKFAGLRILSWNNGENPKDLFVKNLSVTEVTPFPIVAQNIETANLSAISSDLGSITAGSLAIGDNDEFEVTNAGALTATGATITGDITANSLSLGQSVTIGTANLATSVGGRNLIPINSLENGAGTNGTLTTDKDGGKFAVQKTVTTNALFRVAANWTEHDNNVAYSTSFWAKASAATNATIDWCDSHNTSISLTTDYQYFSFPNKVINSTHMGNSYEGFFDITHQTADTDLTLTISHLKIEKGTEVTGWSPAPEDQFVQGNAGITIESDKIYQGTGTHNNDNTGFYLDEDGKFSLKDDLSFDGTNLAVKGNVSAKSITIAQPTTPTVPSGMNVPDGETTVVLTKNQDSNGSTNPGEIRMQSGYFRLARDLKRTVSSDVRILSSYENNIVPPGNKFYVISGEGRAWGNNTDGDETNNGRFHGGNDNATINNSANIQGFFIAKHENSQWKAVNNNNATVNFTPASTDYCIAVGTKSTTDNGTGIDTLVQTQRNGTFVLPDNTTDDINAGVTIESGGITMSSGGFIKGGQSGFDTGSDGFFLGYDTDAYKFSIGDVDGDKLTWDGSDLAITGEITATSGTFTGAVNASSGTFTGDVSTTAKFTAGNVGLDGTSGDTDTVRIFAGHSTPSSALFKVTDGGAVTATSGTIGSLTLASDKVTIGSSTVHGNADAKFYADNSGNFGLGDKLTFDGSALSVSGAVTATSGSFGGITIANSKIYTGDGNFGNSNTGFYLDNTGDFSLSNKFKFDISASTLTVDGTIEADEFSTLEGKPVPEITVGTKLQSQATLSPRVVIFGGDPVFYAALEDNTRIYLNNVLVATVNKGASSTIAAADLDKGDIIHSTKPVSLRQNGSPLPTLAATGQFFATGNRPDYTYLHFGIYSPYADGQIKYFNFASIEPEDANSDSLIDWSDDNAYNASTNPNGWKTKALTQGSVAELTIERSSSTANGFQWFQADTPVVISSAASTSQTWFGGDLRDVKLLKEVSREILSYDEGFQIKYSPSNTGTIVNDNTGSSAWRYSKSTGDLLFSHTDQGDGDGSDGVQGIPWKMCGDTYVIDHGLRSYQIATIEPSVISAYYWTGSAWTLYKTHDFSTASRASFASHSEGDSDDHGVDNSNFIGQSDADKPWRFIGTGRFALRVNTPGYDNTTDGYDDDEYFVLGYDSNLRSQETIRVGQLIAEDISADAITGEKILSTTNIKVGPSGSEQVGLDGSGTGDSAVRIYAGNTTPGSAPFRVTNDGSLTATGATISGAITATSLTIGESATVSGLSSTDVSGLGTAATTDATAYATASQGTKADNALVASTYNNAITGFQIPTKDVVLDGFDDSEWVVGNVTNNVGKWSAMAGQNGENESSIAIETGPHGIPAKVWTGVSYDIGSPSGSNRDGGFDIKDSERITITNNRVYRFTVFVKKNGTDGSFYFGGHNYNSSGTNIGFPYHNLNSLSNTNQYWYSGTDLPTQDEWYLLAGYIQPEKTVDGTQVAGVNSGLSGAYKLSDGTKHGFSSDLMFHKDATKFSVRVFNDSASSTTGGAEVNYAHPRIEIVDENTPSIEQLIAGAKFDPNAGVPTALQTINVANGSTNIEIIPNETQPTGQSYSDGEFRIGIGTLKLNNETDRVNTAATTLSAPYEGGLLPPYKGNNFYLISSATAPYGSTSRFTTLSGSNNGINLFVAIYDPVNAQWYAVDNNNKAEAFTPLDTDYVVAEAHKSVSGGGIDRFSMLTSVVNDPDADVTAPRVAPNVFASKLAWNFDDGIQGWTVNANGDLTITHNSEGYLELESSDDDPILISPTINFNGNTADKIRVKLRRTGGTDWHGALFWANSEHSYVGGSHGYYKLISDPTEGTVGTEWIIAEWDMANPTYSGNNDPTDWNDHPITNIRIDLGSADGDDFEIDWIAIGSIGANPMHEGATIQSGTVGSVQIEQDKLYHGTGSFANENTAFYLDSDGDFSLKNNLTYDSSAKQLKVNGEIKASKLSLIGNAPVLPSEDLQPKGERTVTFSPNEDPNGNSNIGEIAIGEGYFRLDKTVKRSVTSELKLHTPYENATRPPYAGNYFYLFSGDGRVWNTDSSARFQTSDTHTANDSASVAGYFAAIYDIDNTQWKAVDNSNNTVNFTPASTDYIVAVGRKTATSGGIETLVATQPTASEFALPDNTTDDLETGLTITKGGITLSGSGDAFIKSGQTAYNTGTGFFLGKDSGTDKFSIGNSTANQPSLTWNGSDLTIRGDITADSLTLNSGITIGTTNLPDAALNENVTASSLNISNTDVSGLGSAATTEASAYATSTQGDTADSASQVNVGLAFIPNKMLTGAAGDTSTLIDGNGEALICGVDKNGNPAPGTDGFIQWNGSKITVERIQYTDTGTTNGLSLLTQQANRKGFIVFDTAKGDDFDVNNVDMDIAFAWKVGTQWYYDKNSSSSTTSFTPTDDYVALGYVETSTSDLILKGGLFGHPIPLEQAAFPGDVVESGTIGGIKIDSEKLYAGNGNFFSSDTGFYLKNDGDFSLSNKLKFDESADTLTLTGDITANALTLGAGVTIGTDNLPDEVLNDNVGPGGTHNKDPYFEKGSWFDNTGTAAIGSVYPTNSIVTDATGLPTGRSTHFRSLDNDDANEQFFSELMPITEGKLYKVTVWAKQSGDRHNYLLVDFRNAAGERINNGGISGGTPSTDATSPLHNSTGWTGIGTYHYWKVANTEFNSDWTKYEIVMGGDDTFGFSSGTDSNGRDRNPVEFRVGALVTRDGSTNSTVDIAEYTVTEIDADDYFAANTNTVNHNPDFKLRNIYGRPEGIKALYGSGVQANVYYEDEYNSSNVVLKHSSDTSIGMGWPAMRLDTGVTYTITVRAKVTGSSNKNNGFYIRMQEYDSDLSPGKTHISATSGITQVSGVQSPTRQIMTLRDNASITTSFVDYTVEYTPTATAKWGSLILLNWTGMGSEGLVVEYGRVTPNSLNKVRGSVGGITVTSDKLYHGGGVFNSGSTGFYLDSGGNFSLSNKLSFDGDELTVGGIIKGEGIVAGTVEGSAIKSNTLIEAYSTDDDDEIVESTYAALDGTDDTYRIYAGSSVPDSAPFSVQANGSVVARDLRLFTAEGELYFDSSQGFGDAALSQVAAYLGERVHQFSKPFITGTGHGSSPDHINGYADTNDYREWEKVTTVETTSVTVTAKIDTSSMYGYGSHIQYDSLYGYRGTGYLQHFIGGWENTSTNATGTGINNHMNAAEPTEDWPTSNVTLSTNNFVRDIYAPGGTGSSFPAEGSRDSTPVGDEVSFYHNELIKLHFADLPPGSITITGVTGARYAPNGGDAAYPFTSTNNTITRFGDNNEGILWMRIYQQGSDTFGFTINTPAGYGNISYTGGKIGSNRVDILTPAYDAIPEYIYLTVNRRLANGNSTPTRVIDHDLTGYGTQLSSGALRLKKASLENSTNPNYNAAAGEFVPVVESSDGATPVSHTGDGSFNNTYFGHTVGSGDVRFGIKTNEGVVDASGYAIVQSSAASLTADEYYFDVQISNSTPGPQAYDWMSFDTADSCTLVWSAPTTSAGFALEDGQATQADDIPANKLVYGSVDRVINTASQVRVKEVDLRVDEDIQCYGNVTAYYSDERFKNRTRIIDDALEKVKSLEGFFYEESDLANSLGYNTGKEMVGLSAQQVQKILPEAVTLAPVDMEKLEDGSTVSKSGENYLTVDYSKLVPLLVEAMKDQQKQIEDLTEKLEKLEK